VSWSKRFEEPVELLDGRKLKTFTEAMTWPAKEILAMDHIGKSAVIASPRGRHTMANDEQLNPNDVPVPTEKKKIVKTGGKDIAEAKTAEIAEDVAGRLNSEEAQREEDRWA